MLTACVAPPLPNHELPHQVSIQPSPGQRVFEIVTPPGGLLVRRLAADLAGLGHEVAWVRPPPFEPDLSSLASLLLMALAAARRPMSAGREPVIVMESPTSAQAGLLGELLTPYAPGAFTPSVVLIVNVRLRTCVIGRRYAPQASLLLCSPGPGARARPRRPRPISSSCAATHVSTSLIWRHINTINASGSSATNSG
jgi:hypothetical protein